MFKVMNDMVQHHSSDGDLMWGTAELPQASSSLKLHVHYVLLLW